jgi:hypothetical protein
MRDLKGAHLRLWLYFNKNQDGYKFELSQKACLEWGIKKDSYYSGIEEFIKKGYLIPIHYGSNVYQFYEIPQAEKANAEKTNWFSENENRSTVSQKKKLDFPERNNTNNTEIKQNITIDDDNAKGVIVDCGEATIQQEESFDERMERWFGTYRKEKVCESPDFLTNKYF